MKYREFDFQVYDYAQIGDSHFLLSQSDIKVLDESLQLVCRMPIQAKETYEKMAISSDCILLMKNDFTIIGGDEGHEIHAPSIKLLLLNRNGDHQWSHIINNGYGLAIAIQAQQLSIIYSGFGDNGVGEAEVIYLTTDLKFNSMKKNIIHRNDRIFEFPVCESVFNEWGQTILFNTDGEFYLWGVDGGAEVLWLSDEARSRLINNFHKIRNMHFYPSESALLVSYSTGKILRFIYQKGALELISNFETDSENYYQVIAKTPIGEKLISSSRGKTLIYSKPNALRFIEDL